MAHGATVRSLVFACSVISLLACAGCKTTSAQSQSPIPDPVELVTTGDNWTEISAGVVRNIGGANEARLFVFGTGKALERPLQNPGPGPFDVPLPSSAGVGGHWANDQQTVQLANGDILLSWNGFSNTFDAEFKESEWWDKWPTADGTAPAGVGYPADRNGIRPAQLLWRYSAQSGTWSAVANKLDAAEVGATDPQGNVVRSYCAQGVPWVAGFDRPELYADPWGVNAADPSQQRLYVAVRCGRLDDDSTQVFMSNDSGATWQDSTLRLPAGIATVTATPSGRLFILQGWTTLFISDDQGKTFTQVSKGDDPLQTGFDITAPGFPVAALQGEDMGVGPPFLTPTPLAAMGPSSVLAVYPSVETVTVGGKSIKRQVAVVVMIGVPKKPEPTPFIVSPLVVIRAKAAEGSVILPSFITDTRPVGNPASMLYWLETTSKPADPGTDPVTLVARYVLFAGKGMFPSQPADLSDPAGFQTTKIAPYGFGDYMEGTFYYDDALQTLNFVAVWPQQKSDGTIKAFARVMSFTEGKATPPEVETVKGAKPAPAARRTPGYETPCETCRRTQ